MVEFEVEGMSCQHCVAAVTRAVHDVDPQATVDVDLDRGRVRVGSSCSNDLLREAIDEAGYTATSSGKA